MSAHYATVKIRDARLLRLSVSCLGPANSDANSEHRAGDSYATTK